MSNGGTLKEERMDFDDDAIPGIDWEILSDALGALSLSVLFLAALALPHLL